MVMSISCSPASSRPTGIGVDDMFVIIGALNNLTPDEREMEIPEKVGRILRHAGVSVTVTSLTDIVAFAIGASTVGGAVTGVYLPTYMYLTRYVFTRL